MSPQQSSSESDDGENVILPESKFAANRNGSQKKVLVRAAPPGDDKVNVDGGKAGVSQVEDGGDEASENGDDEIFLVESIMDHRFGGSKNDELFFHVKWENYPNKKDWTWEPEENLMGGSDEIMQTYFQKIGGRPEPKSPEIRGSARKRARTSAASTLTPARSASKKTRVSNLSLTLGDEVDEEFSLTTSGSNWKPPSGSWEEHIANIDTIEKSTKGLVCFVHWSNGNKSQHDLNVIYKKCPQKMLSFYEQHLVFKQSEDETSTRASTQSE